MGLHLKYSKDIRADALKASKVIGLFYFSRALQKKHNELKR